MKKLEKVIRKNGFEYRQIKRNETTAIYSQHRSDGTLSGYEVFEVKVRKEGIRFGKFYPCSEVFPSNSDFGKTAWSVATLERAEIRLKLIAAKKRKNSLATA